MMLDKYPTANRFERSDGELRGRFGGMSSGHRTPGDVPVNQGRATFVRRLVTGSLLVALASIVVISWSLRGLPAGTGARASAPEKAVAPEGNAISVKTIRPRNDPSFRMTVEQPAYVEAYYRADLQARVAGPVKHLEVAIGDRVRAGDVLVRIDVPDLEADVRQREAVVAQRQQELALARAYEKTAASAVEFARALIPERESDRQRAESIQSFREKELRRFKGLASGSSPAVTADVVDERTQFYEAAVADVKAAQAGIDKAKAGLSEAEAKLDAAQLDVALKDSLVNVAKSDLDRAKTMLDFASIRAPFDGVVTRRNIDPGAFVQNAATGRTEPMLTVARTDVVTVYMKLPDNYASYLRSGTEATIEMGALPGWRISGKVTRFSPSLETPEHDRTMRVEMDLFNGSAADYQRLVEQAAGNGNAGFKGRVLPAFPTVNGQTSAGLDGRLLPGMFGTMRLTLQKFNNARLIPSTALVSQGGRYFLYLVKDGTAVRTPVDVQVDDGRLAKVVLVEVVGGHEVRRDLTGEETVVVSNQGELSDGQAVKATPSDW
jgi:multidrug efflux pump subunit AcrA (membrane-fusion protein)